jgi:hypothetical protein
MAVHCVLQLLCSRVRSRVVYDCVCVEITAIVTLDSLPVVVSADANGIICIWAVRGYLSPYR